MLNPCDPLYGELCIGEVFRFVRTPTCTLLECPHHDPEWEAKVKIGQDVSTCSKEESETIYELIRQIWIRVGVLRHALCIAAEEPQSSWVAFWFKVAKLRYSQQAACTRPTQLTTED